MTATPDKETPPAAPAGAPPPPLKEPESLPEVRALDPAKVRFFRAGAWLRVTIEDERTVLKAVPLQAFPVTHPDRFISILDGGNKEVGMLASLDGLDEESRRLLREELARRYRVPIIRRVLSVQERFGVEEWDVETSHGRASFSTHNLFDNATPTADGRLVLTDVDGNRHAVDASTELDAISRRLLTPYL